MTTKTPYESIDLARMYPDLHRVWQTHMANRAMIHELVDTLQVIADKIDRASGSPTFTSEEHDTLVALLAKVRGEP